MHPVEQRLKDLEVKRIADAMRGRHALDHFRVLSKLDHEIIRAHVAKYAPRGLPCICGGAEWSIESTLTMETMVQGGIGGVRLGSNLMPCVALTAVCCGTRTQLDALTVGLLKIEELPQELSEPIRRRVSLNVRAEAGLPTAAAA